MYNKIYNKSEQEVLKIIFENPLTKFHIRGMARIAGLNPNTILNITKNFEREKLLKIEKKQHITEISANPENKEFTKQKRIFNLYSIANSGIEDFLVKKYAPKAISVIGSYSKGEDIEKSDIDIVIISNIEKSEDLSKFEKILSRKIHLIITDYKKMSDEFYINLINGIIIHGFIDKK